MFECKKPQFTNDQSIIDIDWNHPEYGWIPFSATSDDVDVHGRAIYQAAIAGAYGEIAPFIQTEAAQKGYRVIIPVSEFRSCFTDAEQLKIKAATYTDPSVGLTYDNFLVMQFVNLTDPSVIAALDLYIEKGLIDPRRKAEILALEEL